MSGLTPCFAASRVSSTAPASDPWSVSATAGISYSAARAASAGIRQAPSRMEYSEWTWRWTNGAVSGTAKPLYKGVPTRPFRSPCRHADGGNGVTETAAVLSRHVPSLPTCRPLHVPLTVPKKHLLPPLGQAESHLHPVAA